MFENSHDDSNLLRGKLFWSFETDLFEGVDSSFSLVISELVDVWNVLFFDVVEEIHFNFLNIVCWISLSIQ